MSASASGPARFSPSDRQVSSQETAASGPLPRLQNETVLWPTPHPGAGTRQPCGWRTRHAREGWGPVEGPGVAALGSAMSP